MNEVWKPVKGLEGVYAVSSTGRVKRLARDVATRNGNVIHLKELVMHPAKDEYIEYVLKHSDGKQHLHTAHRLVAEAFIPNPLSLPCINHKDENKYNNAVDNLEWCTYSYNTKYNGNCTRISSKLKGSCRITAFPLDAIRRMLCTLQKRNAADLLKYRIISLRKHLIAEQDGMDLRFHMCNCLRSTYKR